MEKVKEKPICIFGIGGFGREVLCLIIDKYRAENKSIENAVVFSVNDAYFKSNSLMGIPVIPYSRLKIKDYRVVVAVGDPLSRSDIVDFLPTYTEYATIIHPSAILSNWVSLGKGTIVTAGCILTCNIKIGDHAQLNLNTSVGHDCKIGNFFTTAPGVAISGECTIGEKVYIGTKAAIRDKLTICDKVTIGMGGVVVKSIHEEGTYIGNPVSKIK